MPTAPSCPEAILASIPWYPDGLTPEECGAVEAHAADCRACRDELAFLRGEEEPAIELPDAEQIYARVLERITAPSDEDSAPDGAWLSAASVRHLGRAARPVSIAAGLLVALISGMMTTGAIWVVRVAPTYETAAAAPDAAFAGGPQLEVVFRADATASAIQSTLLEAGAIVVSGPTERGVYRLRLAPGVDVEAAREQLRGAGRGVATFAEPARG